MRKLTQRLPIWLELAIIPLGIVLLQYHGIPFWYDVFGLRTGNPWLDWAPAVTASVSLELVNVWEWAFKRQVLVGLVTAILLVLGPLVQTGQPLYDRYQQGTEALSLSSGAEERLTYYRGLAEKRQGWQDDLRTAEQEAQLATRQRIVALPFLEILRTVMLLAALILFAAVVPLALWSLGERLRQRTQPIIQRLQERLRDSKPDWMTETTRQAILQHDDRRLAKRPIFSPYDLRRLAQKLHL